MKSIQVVAAIIKKDNKVLATQRGYGEFKGGWEFPGGKIEVGETSIEALIREIKEELNIVIGVEELFDTIEHEYPTFHLSMKCYICSMLGGKMILNEHQNAKWLSKNDIDSVDWLPADISLIEKLKGRLSE